MSGIRTDGGKSKQLEKKDVVDMVGKKDMVEKKDMITRNTWMMTPMIVTKIIKTNQMIQQAMIRRVSSLFYS